MCQAITVEKQRREKLVTEQTLKVLKEQASSFYCFHLSLASGLICYLLATMMGACWRGSGKGTLY